MAELKSLAKDTAIYGASSIIGKFLMFVMNFCLSKEKVWLTIKSLYILLSSPYWGIIICISAAIYAWFMDSYLYQERKPVLLPLLLYLAGLILSSQV